MKPINTQHLSLRVKQWLWQLAFARTNSSTMRSTPIVEHDRRDAFRIRYAHWLGMRQEKASLSLGRPVDGVPFGLL